MKKRAHDIKMTSQQRLQSQPNVYFISSRLLGKTNKFPLSSPTSHLTHHYFISLEVSLIQQLLGTKSSNRFCLIILKLQRTIVT